MKKMDRCLILGASVSFFLTLEGRGGIISLYFCDEESDYASIFFEQREFGK